MRWHTSIYHCQFTGRRGAGHRRGDAKDRMRPDHGGQAANLLLPHSSRRFRRRNRPIFSNFIPRLTVPCHRPLVVMSRRARSDRRGGRLLCQLVGSEKQCLSCFFSHSSFLMRGLSHTPRGVREIITSALLTAWPRCPRGPILPIYPGQGCVAKSWPVRGLRSQPQE